MASASIVMGIGIIILMGVIGYVDTPTPDWTNVALGTIVGATLVMIGIADLKGRHDHEEV